MKLNKYNRLNKNYLIYKNNIIINNKYKNYINKNLNILIIKINNLKFN